MSISFVYYIPVHFPAQIHADCNGNFRHDILIFRMVHVYRAFGWNISKVNCVSAANIEALKGTLRGGIHSNCLQDETGCLEWKFGSWGGIQPLKPFFKLFKIFFDWLIA